MTSAEFVALVGNMGLDRCQLIRYYLTGTRAWRRCRPPNTCLPMATRSWIESSCRGITLQAHEHNGDVVYRVNAPQWQYRVASTRAPGLSRRRAARAIESEGSECVALNDTSTTQGCIKSSSGVITPKDCKSRRNLVCQTNRSPWQYVFGSHRGAQVLSLRFASTPEIKSTETATLSRRAWADHIESLRYLPRGSRAPWR